jgi:hypothetical protein
MDPLHPITPGPPVVPARRVPPVDRIARISRDGDRPDRKAEERRDQARRRPPEAPEDGEERGPGRIDVRA